MASLAGRLSGRISLATAFALSVALALGIAPAFGLGVGGLTDDGTASITVHKYKTQSASSTPGTSLEGQSLPFGAEPLSGVTFMLFRLDTAKVEGGVSGTAIVADTPSQEGVTAFLGTYRDNTFPTVTHTTDTSGTATFSSLRFGYYLLVESATGGANVEASVPSIVTLPYSQQATGGTSLFNKDVHVYPKNVSLEDAEKTLVPDPVKGYPHVAAPGDTLKYQIAFKVPSAGKVHITDNNCMTGMVIDMLPSNAIGQPTINVQSNYEVVALAKNGKETPLTASDMGFSDTSSTNGQVTWTLTPAIAKAVEAVNTTAAGDIEGQIVKVLVRINALVNDNAHNAGIDVNGQPCIVNTAQIVVNDADGFAVITGKQVKAPAVPVIGFQLTKVDADNKPITSDTASFKIAASYSDATSGTFLRNGTSSADLMATTNIVDGKVAISGLSGANVKSGSMPYTAIADAVDSVVASPGTTQRVELWLVETQSPNGYRILQAPQKVTLEIAKASAGTAVSSKIVGGPLSIVNIMNGQEGSGSFTLPNTGGIGAVLFIVAGVALVSFAIANFARSRKRDKNESSRH